MEYPDIAIFFGRPVRSHILAEQLRRKGFRVTLYNTRGLPGTYVSIPRTFLPALCRLFPTHHQIYLTSYSSFPALCLYLNRIIRGLPYVFNAVGLMSPTYHDRSRRWPCPGLAARGLYPALTDRVLGGASCIVCNSRYLQRELASEFPHYAHKMSTIYNGIDVARFTSGQPIALNGIPAEAKKLLAVMTWDYEAKASGARLLIDAMGLIAERYPEARLIIAAKARHQRYVHANETYLATRPWREAIKIYYNYANIPALLASSDLFVYATPPKSNDSVPRALLEAHAAGLPIVTTATAGCPEVVEDRVTGFVVPYEAKALAHHVADLLAAPGQRQEFGRRGQRRIQEVFSWDRMAESYASLFLQMISN